MSWNIFSKKKKSKITSQTKAYADEVDFVANNVTMVKPLLSSTSYHDKHRRLCDIAQMIDCYTVMLCAKGHELSDSFSVVDSSDMSYCPESTTFTWQHMQAAASNDASGLIEALPFQHIGAQAFISVPIKNHNNVTMGILLGISTKRIDNIDAKTQLLHLLAPSFNAVLECTALRAQLRQFEQRISSLNQSIEVMNADVMREKEKSAESKEIKTVFLTNLSHEIRTPMNAIIGFVDLLETVQSDEERAEFIAIIKQNSKLLLTVIDNLIEISKLQSSYMFSPAYPRQLNALIDKIIKRYELEIKQSKKPVRFRTTYALATPNDTIWNSEEIVSKVLGYLLDNAVKFTNEGEITVGYITNEKEMTFFVRDTGCGIKKGQEESIFNMFCIGDNGVLSAADDDMSKGLGLSLAQKYVALAGGHIWVDPSYSGGACFYFSIPNDKL